MRKQEYPIETARLALRPFQPDDLDGLLAFQSRTDVARYLYWEPRDRAGVREALDRRIHQLGLGDEDGQALALAVVLRETGALIGDIVMWWHSREHRGAEIGYTFNPDYHGRGFATEAVEVLLRLGFAEFGVHRIVGRLDARNQPSAKVLERLGMRREAHFVQNEFVKGEWTDEFVYAILDHEWKARQAAAG